MKLINELGDNLNILINCEYLYSNDWLCFVSWYSINRHLPDAKVTVLCKRKSMSEQFFKWVKKVNINFLLNKEIATDNCLCINPWVFAVRDMGDEDVNYLNSHHCETWLNFLCSPVKSGYFTPFVDCSEGAGNFVLSKWIHTLECPLSKMDRYVSLDVNFNEVRILSLMQQLSSLYSDISRG